MNQKKKNLITHKFSQISLLIPLLFLCLCFSVPIQAKNTYAGNNSTKKVMVSFSSKTKSMVIGKKYSISSFITSQGKNPTIKKIKSSNSKIIKVSGKKLIPKKVGTATISATVNGKKQRIKITVKKAAAKPKLSQLDARKAGFYYGDLRGECIAKIKLTNNSKYTITKVKLTSTAFFDSGWDVFQSKKAKTFTVNLKPKQSKTVKIDFGKYPVAPPDRWNFKVLQMWHK